MALWFLISCGSPFIDDHESASPGTHDQGFDRRNGTIVGVTLLETTLVDITRILGAAPITKDGEGAPRELCYRSSRERDPTALVFEADAMGSWEVVTGFRLLELPSREAQDQCVASALVDSATATAGGIRLGLTRSEVEALLGVPMDATEGRLLYRYDSKVKMTDEQLKRYRDVQGWDVSQDPNFDDIADITLHLTGGRVARIEVFHVLAY